MPSSKRNMTYIPLKPIPMKVPRKARINRQRRTIDLDWDGTIVDSDDNFLPGALDALRQLANTFKLLIHSCRGNYYEGALIVKSRLAEQGIAVEVWSAPGKPPADIYVDNRGYKFTDWASALAYLKEF